MVHHPHRNLMAAIALAAAFGCATAPEPAVDAGHEVDVTATVEAAAPNCDDADPCTLDTVADGVCTHAANVGHNCGADPAHCRYAFCDAAAKCVWTSSAGTVCDAKTGCSAIDCAGGLPCVSVAKPPGAWCALGKGGLCPMGFCWADGTCHAGADAADPCEKGDATPQCRAKTCDATERCTSVATSGAACIPPSGLGICERGACDLAGGCTAVVAVGALCKLAGLPGQSGSCAASGQCLAPAGLPCGPKGTCTMALWDGAGHCVTTGITGKSCSAGVPQCMYGQCSVGGACEAKVPKSGGEPCAAMGKAGPIAGTCDGTGKCTFVVGKPCGSVQCSTSLLSADGICVAQAGVEGKPCNLPASTCGSSFCAKDGSCQLVPAVAGKPCTIGPQSNTCTIGVCDGKGQCKQQVASGNVCTPATGPCWTGVCDPLGACAPVPKPAGVACAIAGAQPCELGTCDGKGACVTKIVPGMVPNSAPFCTGLLCDANGQPTVAMTVPTLVVPPTAMVPDTVCTRKVCLPVAGKGLPNTAVVATPGMPSLLPGICRQSTLCDQNKLIDDPASLPLPTGTPCTGPCALLGGVCDGKGTCVPLEPQFSGCTTGGLCDGLGFCNGVGVCIPIDAPGKACPLPNAAATPCLAGQCLASGACVAVALAPAAPCVSADPTVATAACNAQGACVAETFAAGKPCGVTSTCGSGKMTATGVCAMQYAPAGTPIAPADPLVATLMPLSMCSQWVCDGDGEPNAVLVPGLSGVVCGASPTVCVTMTCDAKGACVAVPNQGQKCPIEDMCANGVCSAQGKCEPVANLSATCPSAGPCWLGQCSGVNLCTQVPVAVGTSCAAPDGDPGSCDGSGHCVTAKTVPGAACVAGPGCPSGIKGVLDKNLNCSANMPDGTPCGLKCVENGTCTGGACIGAPRDSLCKAIGMCNAAAVCVGAADAKPWTASFGTCQWGKPAGAACAGTSSQCAQSVCMVGAAGTPMCVALTLGAVNCDDGNPCTLGDHCSDDVCAGNIANACSDTNPCTGDWCDPKLGCQHASLDGLPCGIGAVCKNSLCVVKP